MIKVKRIDHVAIAVGDRDGAANDLSALFGFCAGAREHVDSQNTDVAFLHPAAPDGQADAPTGPGGPASRSEAGLDSATALEIIAPTSVSGNQGLTRFLDKRGPGLHHICFEVDDLPAALASLKAAGVRLIDEAPRPGARGHMVAFLHPASTGGVLFELCATPHGAPA
jgi:methylmalonyl-CoA/ethylmalonyl-CoA epimerase